MILLKRYSLLTQNFDSLYQSPMLNIVSQPQKSIFSRLTSSAGKFGNDSNTDEKDRHIKLVKLEIALIHERGGNAPDVNSITKHQWDELLILNSKKARNKYYKVLFSREQANLKRQLQKEERKQKHLAEPPEEQSRISYSLGNGSFLLRISKSTINSWRNNRLFRAMQFSEKLIFDCSYDEYMTRSAAIDTANKLSSSFSDNRNDREPFDLHFCNVNFNGVTMKHLERTLPKMRDQNFPLNLHECSYLDLFPNDQFVYLTPHCNNDLREYDANKTYIIGALSGNNEPLSFGKAKELNLEMARLPLRKHIDLKMVYNKILSVHRMMRVMLDLKRTGKWEVALQHVTQWPFPE